MAYHLVAVDFLPPAVIQASLARLAAEFASGAPTAFVRIYCTNLLDPGSRGGHASPLQPATDRGCEHLTLAGIVP